MRRSSFSLALPAVAALLLVVFFAACNSAGDLTGTREAPVPLAEVVAQVNGDLVCAVADFSGLSHGDFITMVDVVFPAPVGTIGFTVASTSEVTTRVEAGARAFDVDDNTVTADPDLSSDPTGGGDCALCDGLGPVLVLGQTDPDGWARRGDEDFPGTVVWSRDDAGSFAVESYKSLDQESNQNEGMELQREPTGMAAFQLTGGTIVAPFSASFSANASLVTVNSDDPTTLGTSFGWSFKGSGGIDDILLCVAPPPPPNGEEGCTPGAWKNRLLRIGDWATAGVDPNATVASVFSEAANVPYAALGGASLIEALSFRGGTTLADKAEILLRAAVAAYLNASHPDVEYPDTAGEVVAAVNAALASQDKDTIIDLATDLDVQNNLGSEVCD